MESEGATPSKVWPPIHDVPFTSTVIADVQNQPGVLDIFHAGGNGRDRKFGTGRTGRYVRVQLEAKEYLTIAETEIYVNPTGGQASLVSPGHLASQRHAPRHPDIQLASASASLRPGARTGIPSSTGRARLLPSRPVAISQDVSESEASHLEDSSEPRIDDQPRGLLRRFGNACKRGWSRVTNSFTQGEGPKTSSPTIASDAFSLDLAHYALAESSLRGEQRATSGERRAFSSPASRAPSPASVTASVSSVTGDRRYNLYSPEMNLLSETEYTDATTPPIQHDYVWFAGAPVAQVTHSVPSGREGQTFVIRFSHANVTVEVLHRNRSGPRIVAHCS
ncbi:MAG: hypothetical protein KY459_06090 [Acidobacteria bacterium]|nr:hypothetical protein [Acidobacteriota bacterium]